MAANSSGVGDGVIYGPEELGSSLFGSLLMRQGLTFGEVGLGGRTARKASWIS